MFYITLQFSNHQFHKLICTYYRDVMFKYNILQPSAILFYLYNECLTLLMPIVNVL